MQDEGHEITLARLGERYCRDLGFFDGNPMASRTLDGADEKRAAREAAQELTGRRQKEWTQVHSASRRLDVCHFEAIRLTLG